MNLRFRPPQQQPAETPAPPAAAAEPRPAAERSVLVQHGIHTGHFPIAGLRVRDVRETLGPLLNIDPQAVAVINGQMVDEETVVTDEVALVSFVKPSAVKG